MDYNFSDMVNEGLRRGLNFEQIAADFTKTLNEIQKKDQEKEARRKYIEDISDSLISWAEGEGDDSLSLAAGMATLTAYNAHGWSTDRLRKFNKDAVDQLEALIELYEMEDKGDPYARDLRRMLDMANEGKKKVEKGDRNDKKTLVNDEKMLLQFLESLGL